MINEEYEALPIEIPDTFIPKKEIDRKDAVERKRKKLRKQNLKKGNLKAYESMTTKPQYRLEKRSKVVDNVELFDEVEELE